MPLTQAPISLASRLTWALSALVVATTLLAAGLYVWRATQHARSELQEKIRSSGAYLQEALSEPLAGGDDEAVGQVARTLMEDDDVVAIGITDAGGRVIFTRRRNTTEHTLAGRVTIARGGVPAGAAAVDYSTARIDRTRLRLLIGVGQTFGAVLLVISIGSVLLVGRLLRQPIGALTEAALLYGTNTARRPAEETIRYREFLPLLTVLSDLESRVNAHVAQLRESEERFRSIFNSVNDAIFIHDASGAILDVNDRMCAMFGYSREEAVAMTVEGLSAGVPPYSQADALDWFDQAVAGGQPVFEWRSRRRGGECFWSEVSMRRAAVGGHDRVLVTVRDITERKAANRALELERRFFAALFEALPGHAYVFDENGRYVRVNANFERTYGAGWVGRSMLDEPGAFPPESRNVLNAALRQVFDTGHVAVEHVVARPDGTGVPRFSTGQSFVFDGVRYGVGVSLDITERKRAEEALARRAASDRLMTRILGRFAVCRGSEFDVAAKAALRATAEQLDVDHAYFIKVDDNGRTWSTKYEWCREGVEGRFFTYQEMPFGTFPWTEARLTAGVTTRIDSLDDYPIEAAAEVAMPDVAAGRCAVLSVPLMDSAGSLRCVVGVDLHHRTRAWSDDEETRLRIVGEAIAGALGRVEAEGEVERHKQSLLQADKLASIGLLVSGVAHEINNPNNLIMLSADMLRAFWTDLRPLLRADAAGGPPLPVAGLPFEQAVERFGVLLDHISGGSVRIQTIVQNLKDFARADTGELTAGIDIRYVVDTSAMLLEALIRRSTDHFSIVHGDVPTITGNAQKLEQVLVNLIANACQSLPDRGRAIAIRTEHLVARGLVAIEVRDTGAGIPGDDLSRILDPFFTTKRDAGGTGLGLSVSYGIVKEHGGEIRFDSEVGAGTIATVLLPVDGPADRKGAA
jgi:PAS domain S-box-containing protein